MSRLEIGSMYIMHNKKYRYQYARFQYGVLEVMVSEFWDSYKERHKHWKRNTWIGLIGGVLASFVYSYYFEPAHGSTSVMLASSLITIVVLWGAASLGLRARQKYYGTPDWWRARAIFAFLAALIILVFIAIFLRIL